MLVGPEQINDTIQKEPKLKKHNILGHSKLQIVIYDQSGGSIA